MGNFDKKRVVADLPDSPDTLFHFLTTKTQIYITEKNGFNKKNIQGLLNMFYICMKKVDFFRGRGGP